MGKGLGFLWWQADAVEDLFCGLKLGNKGEDFDFGATQGTQQGVDLVDFLARLKDRLAKDEVHDETNGVRHEGRD